jgi:hypothetical protein
MMTRFLGRAALEQRDGAGLLDSIHVGLCEHPADLTVEIFQARDDQDGIGHAVCDLDEVAHCTLEALLGVAEEAQVLDLVDAENERGAIDRPHEAAECGNDLEGAILAGVGVERGNGLMRELGQRASIKILPDSLVYARVAPLQIEQSPHDVDVEALSDVLGARDDLVCELQDECRELGVVQVRFA